ncbi:MAG: hypothetical protein U0793_28415 [Gemmataceae bacterium]
MSQGDFRDAPRSSRPGGWEEQGFGGADDVQAREAWPRSVQWGLAALAIGCTTIIASFVALVFNVALFRGGPAGIPVTLAFAAGLIGVIAGFLLAVFSIIFGIRGWLHAAAERSTPALAVAGTLASATGLIFWIIAGVDLIMVLGGFLR